MLVWIFKGMLTTVWDHFDVIIYKLYLALLCLWYQFCWRPRRQCVYDRNLEREKIPVMVNFYWKTKFAYKMTF